MELQTMPWWMLAGLGVLVVVQLTVEIWALVDLYRRPADRVVLGKKWVWVLIILFVNLVGAIVYFAVGRVPAPAAEVTPDTPTSDRAARAADALYGEPRSTGTDRS